MGSATYKETLNLPQTDFPMAANLTQREPAIRAQWEESRLYQRIRDDRKSAESYILHDGPPYANGSVHLGTGLNKVLKDIVVRYKTMRGYNSPYVPGWDCHGLPIEHRVMKELGEKAKTMEKSEIRKLCQEFAAKHVDLQRNQFKSLGVLGDWGNPYLTYSPQYETSIIELFEKLWEKGHIYKKNKPIHWCMNCRTALAEAELEYKKMESPSIRVKCEITSGLPDELHFRDMTPSHGNLNIRYYIMIWTTTPWTLPANVAIAAHPDYEYVAVLNSLNNEVYIVSKYFAVNQYPTTSHYSLSPVIKGCNLNSIKYKSPLSSPASSNQVCPQVCPVVLADYVRLEEGTGFVHIAPGHGEEDYQVGLKNNLPVLSPVNEEGNFTNEATACAIDQDYLATALSLSWSRPPNSQATSATKAPERITGKNVFEGNRIIREWLHDNNLLDFDAKIDHDYPCCWRCKEPVIFRATEQWFIAVDANDGRARALEAIKKTQWVPSWGKIRIESMVKDRPDWCISRQRCWGVPIPAFYCAKCGNVHLNKKSLAAVKELFAKEGANAWFKTPAEKILGSDARCEKCGSGIFNKESDIFDVWFESAASHLAVSMKNPDLRDHYPPDLYLEGTDQHRGWFQVSLLAAILSDGRAPFKTVVTHGFLVDARTGDKMSKSGFLVPADEVVTKLGADILRLWIASIDFTDDIPASWEILKERAEPYKKIRNTFRFLLGNTGDFDPAKDRVAYEKLCPIDRWALLKLHSLIRETTDGYENFEFFRVYHKLYNFCVVEMSAMYFAVLKDRLYTFAKRSVERRSAQTVLHDILIALTKLYSPILAHTCEEIWSHIYHKEANCGNIVLSAWPSCDNAYLGEAVASEWEVLFKTREEVFRELEKLRAAKTIGSSLEATVTLYSESEEVGKLLEKYLGELEAFFIVSSCRISKTKDARFVEAAGLKGLYTLVEKSNAPKCARCWNLRESVGKESRHPDICARCVAAIS